MSLQQGGLGGRPTGYGRPGGDAPNYNSGHATNSYLTRLMATVGINQRTAHGRDNTDPNSGFQSYSYNKGRGTGVFNGMFDTEEGSVSDETYRLEIIEQAAYKGTELYTILHNRHGRFYTAVKAALDYFPRPDKMLNRDPVVGEFIDEVLNNLSLYRYCCSYACILFSATLADYALAGRSEELVRNEKIQYDIVFNNFINILGMQFLSWLEFHPDAITLQNRLSPNIRERIEKFENTIDSIQGMILSVSIGNNQVPFPWKKGALKRIIDKTHSGSPICEISSMYNDITHQNNTSWTNSNTSQLLEEGYGTGMPSWMGEYINRQENINYEYQNEVEREKSGFNIPVHKNDQWSNESLGRDEHQNLIRLAKKVTKDNRLDFNPNHWFKPIPGTDQFVIDPDYFMYIADSMVYEGNGPQQNIYVKNDIKNPKLTKFGFVNRNYYCLNKTTNELNCINSKEDINGAVYTLDSEGNKTELISIKEYEEGLVTEPGIDYGRSGWLSIGCVPVVRFDWNRGLYSYENIYVGEDNVKLVLTNPEKVIPKLNGDDEKVAMASFDQYIAEVDNLVTTTELSEAHTECNEIKSKPKVVYGNAPIEVDTNEDVIKAVRDISNIVKERIDYDPDILVLPMISRKSITIDDVDFNYNLIQQHLPLLITGAQININGEEFFNTIKNKLKVIGSQELTNIVSNHLTNVINRWFVECRFYSEDKEDRNYLAVENILEDFNEFITKSKIHDPSTCKALYKLHDNNFLCENLTLFANKETQEKYINKSIKNIENEILKNARKNSLEKSVLLEREYAFAKINPMKPLDYNGRVVIEGSYIPEMRWVIDNIPNYLFKHFNRKVPLVIGFGKDSAPKIWSVTRSDFCENKFSLRRISLGSPLPLFKIMQ